MILIVREHFLSELYINILRMDVAESLDKRKSHVWCLLFFNFFTCIHLTIWYQSFLDFWMVHTSVFVHPHDQKAVTRLENVGQLNERGGKKLDINLLNRQPLSENFIRHSCAHFKGYQTALAKYENLSLYRSIIKSQFSYCL